MRIFQRSQTYNAILYANSRAYVQSCQQKFATNLDLHRLRLVVVMKRRSKQRMTAIHVSIPVRLLEDFDETLSFNQSRSAAISKLIKRELAEGNNQGIANASTRQLMAALSSRQDIEPWFSRVLLEILTKGS